MNREDLKNYRYSQKWINRQLERYEEQRTTAMNISINLDGMPKAQNKPNYALEELMDKYNEIREILNKDQEKQNEIIRQIHKVPEPHRTILTDKYILGMTLEEISVDINYAYENVCRMHGVALNMFDNVCKEKSSVNIKTNQ